MLTLIIRITKVCFELNFRNALEVENFNYKVALYKLILWAAYIFILMMGYVNLIHFLKR